MNSKNEDLRDLVIDQVDDARDLLELAQQLEQYLPIESFKHLDAQVGDRSLQFRDSDFDLRSLGHLIPPIAFPVMSLSGLVERLGEVMRLVPPHLGVDVESEKGARRVLRSQGPLGMFGGSRPQNAVGVAVSPGLTPPAVPSTSVTATEQ